MLRRHEEARSKAFETLGGQGLSLSEELLNNPKAFQAALKSAGIQVTDTKRDTLMTLPPPLGACFEQLLLAQQTIRAYGGRFLSFDRGDGRLRSRFEQIGASTGRLSSTHPTFRVFLLKTKHATPSVRRLNGSLSSQIMLAVSFGFG